MSTPARTPGNAETRAAPAAEHPPSRSDVTRRGVEHDVAQRGDAHGVVAHAPVDHGPIEHERPEDWGWHADFGRLARIAGWISVLVILAGLTVPHYNNAGTVAILITAGLMVLGLLWDARKRRTSWRR